MLYHLFQWLEENFDTPGAGLFQYISFRAGLAAALSLVISMMLGGRIIHILEKRQCKEEIRPLGLSGEEEKANTPTMGGLILIAGIFLPTLLLTRLDNVYVVLLLFTTLWMGGIGFLDDYIKLRRNKAGLKARFKVIGQLVCGLVAAIVFVFHQDVVIRQFQGQSDSFVSSNYHDVKQLVTTIPFFKNNELNYELIFSFFGNYHWVGYLVLVTFIIIAVSNGANITDGLDGLAAGTSAITGLTLAIFAYLSSNVIFSGYLNIMHIPHLGEVVIFCAAFVGACVGFLWYNAYPAQVFMGDTGSLVLGALIAVLSIIVRKELLIPLFCGAFLIENLSVVSQVSYYRYTRKRFGSGRRIFLMAPIHHHFQMKGWHESKIVLRFWALSILLAVLSLVTLKVR